MEASETKGAQEPAGSPGGGVQHERNDAEGILRWKLSSWLPRLIPKLEHRSILEGTSLKPLRQDPQEGHPKVDVHLFVHHSLPDRGVLAGHQKM